MIPDGDRPPATITFLLIATSCGGGDAVEATDGGAGDSNAADQLTAQCRPVVFSSVPPDLDEFPPIDADAESALAELINGPTGVEAQDFAGQVRWSIASRSDTELILFGQPEAAPEPAWLTAKFDKQDGSWRPNSWGGCRVEIVAPGFGPATVGTEPGQPPSNGATELDLLINERECASGRAPVDREVVTLVTETPETVTVIALVAPVEGGAECPSNPWHPVAVTLDEPLGDRQLLDGTVFPARQVESADLAD